MSLTKEQIQQIARQSGTLQEALELIDEKKESLATHLVITDYELGIWLGLDPEKYGVVGTNMTTPYAAVLLSECQRIDQNIHIQILPIEDQIVLHLCSQLFLRKNG